MTQLDLDNHPLSPLWDLVETDAERTLLKSTLVRLDLSRGDKIINEGDPIDYLHYLHSGKVKLYRDGIGQREHIVRMAGVGTFFGMRPFFSGHNAPSSASACGEAVVIRIPVSTIRSLLETNTAISRYFLNALAVELDIQEARMMSLMQKHLRGRLAETLLMLGEHYGYETDGETLAINLSRSDLASLSNMTTSNASRTLSLFASERIIALDKRRIRIINHDMLKHVSRLG